ncbi:NAD(P)/FAD-dependent oxidoreductase [Bacillus horti]|uniref:Rossmann fold flavoprotein n=1 Tax=Caldalkalibacillus horti TaxID=77523 RepID=A0ABT9VWP1_9BACI|nr:NAD(P)/FAD-dependent oxidoreductase [Bacillus horti]MDQ0165413.1 putative Rossmann fold flavoprotein [Bacillus horti]
MKVYDVIVVGGGPSGLMAAASAGMLGANVLLLDKGNKLGRKLAISGGGRCNVTNRIPIEEMIKNIPGNGRFMYSPFATFNNEDIISFFEQLGIALKEEDRGRMFPVNNKAKSVVDALIRKVNEGNAEIKVNTSVKDVLYKEDRVEGVLLESGEQLLAKSVILAVGGKSVPHTGSTGDGYAWAEKAGHHVTELFPTEVPLISEEPFIQDRSLQGLALREVTLTVINHKGKKVITHDGDLLFTHFGLSGPIALRCSQFVYKVQKQGDVNDVLLTVDIFPSLAAADIEQELLELLKQQPHKMIKNILGQRIPERLLPILFEKAKLAEDRTFHELPKKAFQQFVQLLKAFPIRVHGTRSIEEAFVTGGGVSVKEIQPNTMASKKKQGLYFCGEILDIHGYTGGYNITCALSTGFVAGRHAGLEVTSPLNTN